MTGSKDYNQANVTSVYEGYRAEGFKKVHYIEQSGLGHSMPSTDYLDKAIQLVDAPLVEAAKKHYTDAGKRPASNRLGDALLLYRKALMHGRNADCYTDALKKAEKLQGEYDKAYALVEAAIDSKDNAAFRQATAALRRTWGAIADREFLKELNDRFRQAR